MLNSVLEFEHSIYHGGVLIKQTLSQSKVPICAYTGTYEYNLRNSILELESTHKI